MNERYPSPSVSQLLQLLTLLAALAWGQHASAVTYANTATTFNWINAGAHTKLGPTTGGIYSPSYRFQNTGGCGTAPPVIDDTLTDNIPIGFTFMYGGQNFTQVRVMSNGRLQFNNNTTCGYGSAVTQLPYPNAGLDNTMRIYGGDLDPSLQSEIGGAYTTACTDRNVCYVSYATIGTAPYRSFVVTWSNVPEWTTFASTSGNYNLQVILQENGEYIYQYGNSTPGPGHTVGQVGWQANIGSNDYDVPAVGFPVSGTALKFYIARPVAEYRMEQPGWNGTPGEVLDTSGNARHATAIALGGATRPQDVAGGRVCRGGQIADNNSLAAISAIDTSIAVPTTVGSSGTISFWYNNSSNNRMLFDASVVNNRWFYLQRNNNRALIFTVTDSGNTNRAVTTANNVIPNNGWSHIVASWSFNNLAAGNSDRLRIWVDGVLRQTSAFTTANTISPQIGTLYIGDNRSGISPNINSAGNPGGSNATLDEFRIYNYEGGAALVSRDYNLTGACLNHYAISHAGSGQACQTNNVTVTAHDVAHGLIIMPNNTTQISLSTSTGQGDWTLVNGYGVLNNGTANDGTATYLFNGEYQAVFGLSHSTPGTVDIDVTDGQIVEGAGEDPGLVLSACFANYNACHDYATTHCSAATGKLFTRLAGVNSSYDVVALDGSDNVATTFTGRAVVSLIARTAAGTVDAQNCFTPDHTQVLDNAATSFTAGRLTLNSIAVANAYRDARIRVVCDTTNCPPLGMTWCSVDNFAVRPQSFSVTSTNANADATGTSATNTPAIKAGAAFNLTATAVAGYDGTPLIDGAQVAAHAGATGPGAVSGAFGAANGATGIATGVSFGYSEVGYFRLNATGVYDDSFTSVDVVSDCTNDFSNTAVGGKFGCRFGNSSATSYFGRFIPDHFNVELVTVAGVPMLCGGLTCPNNLLGASGFVYSGQPFSVRVTARNPAGTTQNYRGVYAKAVTLSAWDALGSIVTQDPGGGAVGGGSITAATFAAGVAVTATPTYTFGTLPTVPTDIYVRASDADNVSSRIATLPGSSVEPGLKIVSGRIKVSNAYGSELLPLRLQANAQYFTANGWVNSITDSVTDLIVNANYAVGTGTSNTTLTPASSTLNNGVLSIRLSAPNVAGTATVLPGITGCVAPCAYMPVTAGTATFGVYKNPNNYIYRREN
ncbi:MAG: LamG domain-containing protein [Sideroxyarcus sp.]|nr:LamG domain-containing protein [Sideroxyarcus sp.]